MTATVTIKTRESTNVVRLPNAALRYKPSPPLGPNGVPIAQPPEPPLAKGTGRVFVVTNDKPGEQVSEPRILQIGVTDGMQTEVIRGLDIDAKVVTDETDLVDPKKKKGKLF
jgi:HlyD family secretion protein